MDKLKIRIHKLSLYIGILNNFKLIFWYLYEMYCVLWTFEHKQKLTKLFPINSAWNTVWFRIQLAYFPTENIV